MGLLDGDLRDSIYAAFKGKLLSGTLYGAEVPVSGALDALGDPLDVSRPEYPIEGFADAYSAFTHAQAGIPDTDLKLCFFGATIVGVVPQQGWVAKLLKKGVATWYEIRKEGIDPAGALWECQAFVVPQPEDIP